MGATYASAVFYYLVGGLTFPPLCLLAGLIYFVTHAPKVQAGQEHRQQAQSLADEGDDLSQERKAAALDLAARNAQAHEQVQEAQRKGLTDVGAGVKGIPGAAKRLGNVQLPKAHRSGWLVVRRQFEPSGQAVATPSSAPSSSIATKETQPEGNNVQGKVGGNAGGGGGGYMSAMYRGILDYRSNKKQSLAAPASEAYKAPSPGGESASQSRDTSPSRASVGPTASAAATALKDSYFCILKEPILYLYTSEDTSNPTTECLAAIDLRGKRVSIFVAGMGDVEGETGDQENHDTSFDSDASGTAATRIAANWAKAKRASIKDGELFQKRNAIRILAPTSASPGHGRQPEWYIFLRSSTNMEDWYHALIHASLLPKTSAEPYRDPIGPVFDTEDMQNLLTSLDSLPDPIPLRWLNAMVGRIFYSIYRTAWLEEYVTRKLMKKISRVRTPSFLSDIQVKEVHLGSTPPAFSRPMLKSLTGAGEASMEVGIHYTGAMRLTISTVLTISLGSRFKPYNVPLVLAVVLTSLEGNLLLHVKPPPSNRLWFGFTQLPKMEIDIEPVVSERKVQWSMVKRLIEGRIKELLTESVVVPNMDDIPFYDTRPNAKRGGIWAEAAVGTRQASTTSTEAAGITVGKKEEQQKQALNEVSSGVTTARADAGDGDGQSIRNRKSVAEHTADDADDEQPPMQRTGSESMSSPSASPAVAGLSALLARSTASGPTSDTGSTRSQPPSKRKSWFAPATRSNGGGTSSGTAPRHKGPQSSLAWGSASVVPKGATDSPSSAVALPSSEVPALEGGVGEPLTLATELRPKAAHAADEAPALQRDILTHGRNRKSISSVVSDATDTSTATADTDTVNAALEQSLEIQRRDDGEHGESSESELDTPMPAARESRPDQRPMVQIRRPSEDDDQEGSALDIDRDDGSRTPSPLPPTDPLAQAGSPFVSSASPEPPQSALDSISRPVQSFAPPPRRTVSPASMQSNLSRTSSRDSRISVGGLRAPPVEDTASTNASGTRGFSPSTQAALMAGWSKAKASMADKDSRQAAAKEAKDALKKGWASWNAKRAEAKSQASSSASSPAARSVKEEWNRMFGIDDPDSQRNPSQPLRPPSSAHGEDTSSIGSGSWSLGSANTDPTSLGAGFGFEMSPHGSPEWQRNGQTGLAQDVAARLHGGKLPASPDRTRDYRSHRSDVASSQTSSPAQAVRKSAPQAEAAATQQSDAASTLSTSPSATRDGDSFAFLPPAAKPVTALVTPESTASSNEAIAPATFPTGAGPTSEPDIKATPNVKGDETGIAGGDVATPRRPSGSAAAGSSSSVSPSRSQSSGASATTRIRSQPGQMTMMAIPGIPANRRQVGTTGTAAPPQMASSSSPSASLSSPSLGPVPAPPPSSTVAKKASTETGQQAVSSSNGQEPSAALAEEGQATS